MPESNHTAWPSLTPARPVLPIPRRPSPKVPNRDRTWLRLYVRPCYGGHNLFQILLHHSWSRRSHPQGNAIDKSPWPLHGKPHLDVKTSCSNIGGTQNRAVPTFERLCGCWNSMKVLSVTTHMLRARAFTKCNVLLCSNMIQIFWGQTVLEHISANLSLRLCHCGLYMVNLWCALHLKQAHQKTWWATQKCACIQILRKIYPAIPSSHMTYIWITLVVNTGPRESSTNRSKHVHVSESLKDLNCIYISFCTLLSLL